VRRTALSRFLSISTCAATAWAKLNGCPWDELTCQLAAKYGQLEALRWAREHGCKWDAMVCALAAGCGHLEVLQWWGGARLTQLNPTLKGGYSQGLERCSA
jgi:hypothetical protein